MPLEVILMYFGLSFHPLRSSGLASNFSVNKLAFGTSSWPLQISNDVTWGEYQLLALWVEDTHAHLMVTVKTMDQKSKIDLLKRR